jgi:nitroreductase
MSFIPSGMKNHLKKAKKHLSQRLLELVAAHPALIPSYYHHVSDVFDREMRSVYAGRAHHPAINPDNAVSNAYQLRRNIHRLEKGLIMRPRKPVFATGYIDTTVAFFLKLAQQRAHSDDPGLSQLFGWAHDVLEKYFEVVKEGADPRVDETRTLFRSICPVSDKGREKKTPFAMERREKQPVSFDAFRQLTMNRKSVRWFEQRPLPREIVDKAMDAARFAPSACNRQPFEMRVFDDSALIGKIAALAGGAKGTYHNFPCLIVFIGHLRAFNNERDRHMIYIDSSLAAMSLVYAFESQQVASCIINWPDIASRDAEVSKFLGLAPDERVVMLLAAGYPDPKGGLCWSARKPLDEIRSFNRIARSDEPF